MSHILPAEHAAAVTPSDSAELAHESRGIYVGGEGNLVLVTGMGETVTFANVPSGSLLPIRARRVLEATTATNIVALW